MTKPINNPHITLSNKFIAQLKKVPTNIKIAFGETLELFEENPLKPHSHLRNHPLKKQYIGYYSIDVTDDWRALYKMEEGKTQIVIIFHILGTHDQLYG